MKTKVEIVQRLLDEKKIDAEEAAVLLMRNEKDTVYIPYPQPYYPLNPYTPPYRSPFWYGENYCSSGATLNVNGESSITTNWKNVPSTLTI